MRKIEQLKIRLLFVMNLINKCVRISLLKSYMPDEKLSSIKNALRQLRKEKKVGIYYKKYWGVK